MDPLSNDALSTEMPAGQAVLHGGPEVSLPLLWTAADFPLPGTPIDGDDDMPDMSELAPSDGNQDLLKEFDSTTKLTQDRPYNPRHWWLRAKFFLKYDFPELACADAYKAHFLCDPYIRNRLVDRGYLVETPRAAPLEDYAHETRAVLSSALRQLGADNEAAFWEDPCSDVSVRAFTDGKHTIPGQAYMKRNRYPWLDQYLVPRETFSSSFDLAGHALYLDSASFIDPPNREVQGVFTDTTISKGDEILIDRLLDVTIRDPLDQDEEPTAFMTKELIDRIITKQKESQLSNIDILRLGVGQTTDALTVSYDISENNLDLFSFRWNIMDIAHRLFNEDKLFSPDYDFWRIFTLHWRVCTNAFNHKIRERWEEDGEAMETMRPIVGISRLFSFFNHSCEPNADWGPEHRQFGQDEILVMTVNALKDIKPKEEIFISYLPKEDMRKSYLERRKALKSWFGCDCACKKCRREEEKASLQPSRSSTRLRNQGDDKKDG